MKITMYTTLLLSILVQVVTGIIEVGALSIQVPVEYTLLKQMMMLEVIVQSIEGAFYIYWFFHFKEISNITPSRYFDWMITTPTMLVNLIMYLRFLSSTEPLDFFTVLMQERSMIFTILALNWLMLFFGYLGETKHNLSYVGLGFLPFLAYYYLLYKNYGLLSTEGTSVYVYFLFFWTLYGVVAVLPYTLKNMCYNILDLFSKNFFGLFLTYLLYNRRV
jgi:bacteriorhodopsin